MALTLAGGAPAFAHNMNMTDWMQMMEKLRQKQPNPQETPWVSGRVVKISRAGGQSVTIAHDAIESIGMPAMTMTFGVADPSALSGFSKGQRVDVQVENGKVVNFRAPRPATPRSSPHSH